MDYNHDGYYRLKRKFDAFMKRMVDHSEEKKSLRSKTDIAYKSSDTPIAETLGESVLFRLTEQEFMTLIEFAVIGNEILGGYHGLNLIESRRELYS